MDGKGHTILSPIFSTGMCTMLMVSGVVPKQPDVVVTSLAVGLVSILSCKWADYDHLALKPTSIICGTAKQRFSKKYNRNYYYVKYTKKQYIKKYGNKAKVNMNKKDSTKSYGDKDNIKDDFKVEFTNTGSAYVYYDRCKRESIVKLVWAMIFKTMNIEKHRGWQSHSPYIWVPVFTLLTIIAYHIPVYSIYTGLLMLSLSLGYFSHLAGDSLTLMGIPLVPDTKFCNKLFKNLRKIPILGRMFGSYLRILGGDITIFGKKIKFNFATASNYKWTYFVAFLFIAIFAFSISPTSTLSIFGDIFDCLCVVLSFIGKVLSLIFSGIMKVIKG